MNQKKATLKKANVAPRKLNLVNVDVVQARLQLLFFPSVKYPYIEKNLSKGIWWSHDGTLRENSPLAPSGMSKYFLTKAWYNQQSSLLPKNHVS